MDETITFYIDLGNGKMYAANQAQVNLLTFLNKLKIKTASSKTFYVLQTSHISVAGHYTITAQVNVNGNGWTTTSTGITVGNVTPPKPKLVTKEKNFLQPSRADKEKWRQISKAHSRNTGR